MGLIANILTAPPLGLGFTEPSPVEQRQHRQWQMANDMLNSATLSIDAGNTDQATALALMGLLALKLSDS